ncbi:MAG: sugar porter family MFS transporter, partial [Terracidiphilus sp.]
MNATRVDPAVAGHSSLAPATSQTYVYIAATFAAIGGLLFGYDTGVISGALIFIKRSFGLSTFEQELAVSSVLIGAAVLAITGGRLSDLFGRRKMLLITSVVFIAGALVCAFAGSIQILVFGRVMVGMGIGLASSVVPLYISEISPAKARGLQVSLFQLAITVGILVAYLADYAFTPSSGWRWMLGLAVVPGLLLGAGMLFLPETPRFLARHGQFDMAHAVLVRIRGTQDVDKELQEIKATSQESVLHGHISDLLLPALRPALVIGIGLAVFQQVTGINTIIYYAPYIIRTAGISSIRGSILATAGIGTVNVVMTLISMWLIDRVGRRPLLLTGIAGMIVSLGALGYIFHLSAKGGGFAELAVIILMVYVASFAISLGPIFWLLIAEIYPLKIRGLAAGIAAGTNWAANFAVSLTFLSLLKLLGPSATFWLYGVLAIGSWLFSYYLVPETKGRSLE